MTYQEAAELYPMEESSAKNFKLSKDGKILSKIKTTFRDSLIVPEGVETVEFDDMKSYNNLTALILPDSVKQIVGKVRWQGCRSLEAIRLSPNLQLTDRMFEGLKVEELEIPEGVEVIPYRCFAECVDLQSLKLPSTLKFICAEAFDNSYLEELTIPADVKVIFPRAFATGSLKKVTFESADTIVLPEAFDCAQAGDVYSGRELTTQNFGIGEERYEGEDLVYVPAYYCGPLTIKEGTKKVVDLSECDGITELVIPESADYVNYPHYLRKITVPDTETMLDLRNQPCLTEFNWPANLSKFKISYSPIKELIIPEGVTDVEISAMPELEILKTPSTIQNIDINRCPKLQQ